MQNFDFFSASTVEDGLDYLFERQEQCRVIAGGTDLIPLLRTQETCPDHVLDILNVEALKGIAEDRADADAGSVIKEGDRIRIGPTTTFTEIMGSDLLQRTVPLLVQAASSVGAPQIRNRGTVGGNIATASPAADVLPALMALGAILEVRSRTSGTRVLPLTEAMEVPYETRLRPDELITGVFVQKPLPGTCGAFEKLGRRRALARARMNMTVILRKDEDGRVAEARIVPGAVMPVARRMNEAEAILQGRIPDEARIEEAAKALEAGVLQTTGRRWSSEYKLPVLKNVFKRVFKRLL